MSREMMILNKLFHFKDSIVGNNARERKREVYIEQGVFQMFDEMPL